MATYAIDKYSANATEISDTKSATFSIEDERSLGVSLSTNNIILNVQPTAAGAFNSTSITIDVSTNNVTGYNLTMVADRTDLTRIAMVNGETPIIPTIPTGKTFTETTFENGYWGYKIGADVDYLPMTTATSPINITETPANSSVNTITFGAKLDNSIPNGVYSGVNLTFVATANPIPTYEITWDHNNSRNNATSSTIASYGSPISLPDSPTSPENTYYTSFKEWNSKADGAGSPVNASTTVTSDTTFYAIWNFSADTLQGTKSENCSGTKYDARDGGSYEVSILADGNCWALDNLLLTGEMTLKAGDTNSIATGDKVNTFILPASKVEVGDARKDQYLDASFASDTASGGYNGRRGVYYNYCATSAGSYCRAWGIWKDITTAQYDICPAGWRLPTSEEWNTLLGSYSAQISDFVNAAHLVFAGAGTANGASIIYVGRNGLYTSSTIAPVTDTTNSNKSSGIGITSSEATSSEFDRNWTLPVRCILNK